MDVQEGSGAGSGENFSLRTMSLGQMCTEKMREMSGEMFELQS